MPKANKPEASPLTLAKGVAFLAPSEDIPVPSQLIWIRHMAGDSTESLRIAHSVRELEALLPASVVWVAEPLYATEDVLKVIGKTPLSVASLPGLEGEGLYEALKLFSMHETSVRYLGKQVRIWNVKNSYRPAAENHAETAKQLETILRKLWQDEGTLKGVAQALTNKRVPTATGATVWHATQVKRLLIKLGITK